MVTRRHLSIISAFVVVALCAGAVVLLAFGTGTGESKSNIPSARTFSGVPQVGTLYKSAGDSSHGCTASVVASPGQNTIITAAHCVTGTGAGMVFVPGQRGTDAPYGRWTVNSVYVSRRWTTRQDPHADIAVMTVAPQVIDNKSTELQSVTGANQLGSTARAGERVTVIGYPAGTDDDPITCTVRVYITQGYPSFDCQDYVGGTSGSPWLLRRDGHDEVVGIIGGLNQGGCYQYTSYSSPLSRRARRALHRASVHRPGNTAPKAGSDGCH